MYSASYLHVFTQIVLLWSPGDEPKETPSAVEGHEWPALNQFTRVKSIRINGSCDFSPPQPASENGVILQRSCDLSFFLIPVRMMQSLNNRKER